MRKMMNSKIEWVGEIPDTWICTKLKYFLCANDGGVWGNEPLFEGNDKIVIRSTEQTVDGKWVIDSPAMRNLVGISYTKIKIKVGDLLITKSSGSELHIGKTSIADDYFKEHECYYSNFIQRIRTTINSRFVWYILNSSIARAQFIYMQNSTSGLGNINAENIENIYLPVPPISEQQRIADFLDRECEKIDGLKADIGAQIDALEQYKRSVITEAVTHGLDPNVPMKDSGVEFFGEIPTDWNIMRTKYVATSIIKGNGITKEDVVPNGDIPCVRYGEIYSKYNISFRECKTRTNKGNVPILTFCQYGDILFAGTGELVEEIGKNIVYLGAQECLAGGDIIILRHNQNPSFLNYALYAAPSQAQKSSGKSKLKVVHISAFEIGNILIALPPLPEQQAIADYLDEKCAQIDELISQKQSQIETLDAYKKSLIFEYVTGKKEVV